MSIDSEGSSALHLSASDGQQQEPMAPTAASMPKEEREPLLLCTMLNREQAQASIKRDFSAVYIRIFTLMQKMH